VQAVPDLEPGVLDGDGHPVVGPGPAERQQMPARLEHPQAFTPQVDVVGDARRVPLLAHEPKLIGRVGDDAVDRGVVEVL
jgi:hypothetical protein